MNVDTGAFEALRGEVAGLRAAVERLEARTGADLAVLDITFDAGVEAGENRARRAFGLPSRHRDGQAPPRPRHLRRVGDPSRGGSQ